MRRVVLAIPWWVLRYRRQIEIAPIAEALESLFRELPGRVEFLIVTNEESEKGLLDWTGSAGVGDRARVMTVPNEVKFTLWAQDAFVVRCGADGDVVLVEPHRFVRQDDAKLTAAVARYLGVRHERAPLSFQGGNMLVGDDFWLLGADSVRETVEQGLAADDTAAGRAFAQLLDDRRTLHVVGSRLPAHGDLSERRVRDFDRDGVTWREIAYRGSSERTQQPIFDLDAFISLAGRGEDGAYRLLVGDPRLAAQLTGQKLPDHAMPEVFDDIAKQLAGLGFRVVRNPLPLASHDQRATKRRFWYFASSNNVVAEIDGPTRHVWIPTYGDGARPDLTVTDRSNREIWEALGFTTHLLPNFNVLAQGLGAVHCLCKCVGR